MREPSAPAYAAAASNVSAPWLRLFTDFAKRTSHMPPQTRKGECWIARAGNRSLRPKPERSPCAVPLRNMPAACRMRHKPAFSLRNSPHSVPLPSEPSGGSFSLPLCPQGPVCRKNSPGAVRQEVRFPPGQAAPALSAQGRAKTERRCKCQRSKHIRPVGGSGKSEVPRHIGIFPPHSGSSRKKTQTAAHERLRQPETHKQVLFFLHILYCGNYHKSETARAGSGKGCGLDFLPRRRKKSCPGSRISVSRSRRSV